MKCRHAWFGAKGATAVGLFAMSAGCVINSPTATPSSSAPATSQAPGTSGTSPPPVTTSPSPTAARKSLAGPGVYSFAYDGAVGTIQVPASIMDSRLERYGDYRRLAKARAITYLIAQVDNRSSDTITMYEVVVVTDDGQQIEATPISDYVDIWRDAFAGDASGRGVDVENYNRGVALSSASNFFLHPGAKGTAFLGAKQPIKTVKRVFVYPSGAFDRVEAHRIK